MKAIKAILTILPLLLMGGAAEAQQHVTISGYVRDASTGEVLIGAVVTEGTLRHSTTTNGYGFYSLTLPSGSHTILARYMGFESLTHELLAEANTHLPLELRPTAMALAEVTVTAEHRNTPLTQNEFNAERLSVRSIRQLPSIFGEVDVIKAVQHQSGVKTIGDGSSAMFVRGGGSDQNLILIDEAPVYNPSHLFGFVSVFNPDALNHLILYKSNMPAQYGGRVSAVLDCKLKEGNMRGYDFTVGLSPFTAIVTASGPIVRDQASFLVSARKSLVDLILSPMESIVMVPAFHDLNVKVNTRVGSRHRLFLSAYQGNDRTESDLGFYNRWGNSTATLRWNATLNPKLFSNVSVIWSDYQNFLEYNERGRDYQWLTGISDLNLKADLSYQPNPTSTIRFGLGSIHHRFIPGETADTLQSLQRVQALEHAVYVLHDAKLSRWLGVNYGIRLSAFQSFGRAKWYEYDANHNPTTWRSSASGIYSTYWEPEPRLSLNLTVSPRHSLKLAYARNAQYMQVLQSNSLSYTSLETWFPANPNIKPVVASTYSLGWFHSLSSSLMLSVESYYKDIENQIDYVDHAKLVGNPFIEGEVRRGVASAYGVELLIKVDHGRFAGSASYCYSRALRRVEGINGGERYSSPFDIPHDVRLNGSYRLSSRWSLSSAWVYMSGRPVTLPIGFYFESTKEPIPIYSHRNASRFPSYHRLDIAANYSSPDSNGKPRWDVSFGFYNTYARKNPLGYEFTLDSMFWSSESISTGEVRVYQFYIFTIMPNLSAKYYF